jgi:hypothetical protein
VISSPHMNHQPYSLDAFTAAPAASASVAANAPAHARQAVCASGGGPGGKGGGCGRNTRSSDAESEQACAPFAVDQSESPRGGIPALRPAGMTVGSMGSSKAGSLKGGAGGRRSIDITVDATPLVGGCSPVIQHNSTAKVQAAKQVAGCTGSGGSSDVGLAAGTGPVTCVSKVGLLLLSWFCRCWRRQRPWRICPTCATS